MAASVESSRFLEPRVLARIDDLELVVRTVVDGFLAGHHELPHPGTGIEFSQFRSYQPGDDLRRVDWRVYARSDRFFVRESEAERDVGVRFLLDATASMGHEDGGVTKLAVARCLVAALAFLADRQGDRLALHVVGPETGARDRVSGGRDPFRRLLFGLEGIEPSGRWPDLEELAPELRLGRHREIAVLVTDFHDDGEIEGTVRSLRTAGDEVLVLQILARNELELGWDGDLELVDLETGEVVTGPAESLRGPYLERLRADLETRKRTLLELGVDHVVVVTDEPFEEALRSYLLHRGELPR